MYKKRSLAVVFILCILLLNLSTFLASASIFLGNSMELHIIDVREHNETIISHGSINVTNEGDEGIEAHFSVLNYLSEGEYGPDGKPRKHIVDDKAVFDIMPNPSWIQFENDTLYVPGNSYRSMNYTLVIPKQEMLEDICYDRGQGYLNYVLVTGSGSSSVNVNYRFKVFVVFEGIQQNYIYLLATISIILLGVAIFAYDKMKHKIKDRVK